MFRFPSNFKIPSGPMFPTTGLGASLGTSMGLPSLTTMNKSSNTFAVASVLFIFLITLLY